MKDNFDWTDYHDHNIVAEKADSLVRKILQSILHEKLAIHKQCSLNAFELRLLYRWPVYIGVNLFIERLLRIKEQHRNGEINNFPFTDSEFDYFEDTVLSVQAYYYDFSINYKFLADLSDIISYPKTGKKTDLINLPRPQESLGQKRNDGIGLKNLLKYIFVSFEKIYIRIFKPRIIGESSNWFRKLYFFGHSIDFYSHKFQRKKIDTTTREELKRVFNKIFIEHIPVILDDLDNQQIKQCAKRFGEWLDHVLPLSIIEGLQERFEYYQNMLRDWPVEQVHAFTGYFYNDNFKIFAILARRNGAKFIGHTHGLDNYCGFKDLNELRFLDYYTTYGKLNFPLQSRNPLTTNVKFISTGSITLKKIKKWKKQSINSENCILLYPSGPLMDFMSDLQEISPEKIFKHRLQVLSFINQLLKKYHGLKIIYKPFPGTYTNDPIRDYCSDHLNAGRIELTNTKPSAMYSQIDLILWDSISTGFGESVAAGVPVLVFNSRDEYEKTSPRGRIVNDALIKAGVQCFNIDSAMNSFKEIIDNLDGYKKDSASAIQMFNDDMATPVSSKEWHRRFRQGIRAVEGR